ncbi:MAG: class I SAM-dependent RNA methyltransferase, partial [Oscillospiraceae bacterium]|nr:class I SAM-dependent RNA methyltransferase [Oscillospiraceae bacterium]
NICSRYAERVQILAGAFEARSFEELFEGTKALPWENFLPKDADFPVKGYSLNSDLFSVSDCQSIIKKAVVEKLKLKYRLEWFPHTGALYQIQFSIMKNTVSLLIDASGAGLHKRGYRLQANIAPIKETLAAALCNFAQLREYHALYDPMCGSGTILIEGAMLANNIAPGINRKFSAESWGWMDGGIWAKERERAKDLSKKDSVFTAFGSDIDASAIEIAKKNAERAGVGHLITFENADIRDFKDMIKTEKGTVITNPPYGERMADMRTANEIYKSMGRVFENKKGRSYNIITADEDFEKHFGRKADKRRKLYNGMLKCQFFMYYK